LSSDSSSFLPLFSLPLSSLPLSSLFFLCSLLYIGKKFNVKYKSVEETEAAIAAAKEPHEHFIFLLSYLLSSLLSPFLSPFLSLIFYSFLGKKFNVKYKSVEETEAAIAAAKEPRERFFAEVDYVYAKGLLEVHNPHPFKSFKFTTVEELLIQTYGKH